MLGGVVFGCAAWSSRPAESADSTHEPAGVAVDVASVVSGPGRTAKDRQLDRRRHPEQLLEFLELRQGQRVADLGAGSGYTTELLARAVGPEGMVFSQNNALTVDRFVGTSWPGRLARIANRAVVRMDLEFEAPFVPEAKDLDLVVLLFSYHEVVAQGGDTAQLNLEVFRALRPGGRYVIADHRAEPGSELDVAGRLHRIDENLVRRQVEAAGFVWGSSGEFLRNGSDSLTRVSNEMGFVTDRFVMKFVKPR